MTADSDYKSLAIHWSHSHFITFILLYASYADLELSEEEKIHIANFASHSVFEEVLAMFNQLSDFQQLQFILDLKTKFIKTEDDKVSVLKLLKEHFHKDGEFSRPESSLYEFLKRLL